MNESHDRAFEMYEKRYAAQQKIDEARKLCRKARVACAIGAVVIFAIMISFILSAYDNENVVLLFVLIGIYLLAVAAVYYVYGTIKNKNFFKMTRLISRFDDAIELFDKMEAKYAEKTLHPADREKAENRLIKICEDINENL